MQGGCNETCFYGWRIKLQMTNAYVLCAPADCKSSFAFLSCTLNSDITLLFNVALNHYVEK